MTINLPRAGLAHDRRRRNNSLLSAGLMLVAFAPLAAAQSAEQDVFPNCIGFGIGTTPDYLGARSKSVAAAPVLYYRFGSSERALNVVGPLASINLVDQEAFNAGPLVRYNGGRTDVDDTVVRQLRAVDSSFDAGAFVSYGWFGEPEFPWRLRLWAGALTSTRSEGGGSGSLNLDALVPLSQRVLIGAGGSLNYRSAGSMRTNYGISTQDSLDSGLARFSPGGGTSSRDAWLGAVFVLDKHWAIGGGGYLQRLAGDAAASPIVSERGRVNQVTWAIGAVYLWR